MTAQKHDHQHQHQHTYRIPRTLITLIALIVVGLLAAVILSYIQARAVEARLAVLEEYIEGRGEYRDREAERLDQRITDGICDLLDQLPPSPLTDVPRAKYDCGPGAAIADLPPAVQEMLRRGNLPTPTPPDDSVPPRTGIGPNPNGAP